MGNKSQSRNNQQNTSAAKALHAAHMATAEEGAAEQQAYITDDDIAHMRSEGQTFGTSVAAISWLRKQAKKDNRSKLALYFSVISTILRQSIDDVIDEVILVVGEEEVKIFLQPTSYDGKHFFFCVIKERELSTDREGDEEIVKALLDVNIMISDHHSSLAVRLEELTSAGKQRTREFIALSKELLMHNSIAAIEANVVEALVSELAAKKLGEHQEVGVYGVSVSIALQKTGEEIDKDVKKPLPEEEHPLGDSDPGNFFSMLASHTRTNKSPTLAKAYKPSEPLPEDEPASDKGHVGTFFDVMKLTLRGKK